MKIKTRVSRWNLGKCNFGHVGSEPFMRRKEADRSCADSGLSKVIRRPLVEKLGLVREFKLLSRQYVHQS